MKKMNRNCVMMMLVATLVLMLNSCLADVIDEHQNEVPITLTTAVKDNNTHVTRAAIDVLSGTQFGAGETFYAYFPTGVKIGNATSACGTAFTTDGSGGTTAAAAPSFSDAATSANVCAYYGRSGYVSVESTGTQVTNSTTAFTVATDQTTDAAYKASDLMFATASVTKSSTSSTSLTFGHKMAKIIVNITIGTGISKVTGVRIVGGSKTIAIANPTTTDESSAVYLGSVSTATAERISTDAGKYIALYNGEYTSTTAALACAGLIPPQTIGASTTTPFLQVVTAEGTATYSIRNMAFASGQSYTFNITVNADAFGTTIALTFSDWSANGSVTIEPTASAVNFGFQSVDLGLGVLWANMNVGATSETDPGMYFAWGDVIGRPGTLGDNEKVIDNYDFTQQNYKWRVDNDKFVKYVPENKTENWGGSGDPDNKLQLELVDDAARAHWGGSWRMPTEAECKALADTWNSSNYTWTYYDGRTTMYKGIGGAVGWQVTYNVTGATIFLPVTGHRYMKNLDEPGRCSVWSSALSNMPIYSRCLRIEPDNSWRPVSVENTYRSNGLPIRPVRGN